MGTGLWRQLHQNRGRVWSDRYNISAQFEERLGLCVNTAPLVRGNTLTAHGPQIPIFHLALLSFHYSVAGRYTSHHRY